MEALVENLEKKLELKRESTNFYTIEYTHNDPIVARDVTQAALDILLLLNTNASMVMPFVEPTQFKMSFAVCASKLSI